MKKRKWKLSMFVYVILDVLLVDMFVYTDGKREKKNSMENITLVSVF